MTNQERIALIKERLQKALTPTRLEVMDESYQHAGHAGAKTGKGHFAIKITADIFRGKKILEQHRLIYQALGPLMEKEIHALTIHCTLPTQSR